MLHKLRRFPYRRTEWPYFVRVRAERDFEGKKSPFGKILSAFIAREMRSRFCRCFSTSSEARYPFRTKTKGGTCIATSSSPTIYYEQNFLRFGLPNERLDEFDFFQRIDNQLECVFHVVVQSYGVTNQSFAHAHLLLDFLRNFR